MDTNMSPEDKLLRLIKGAKPKGDGPGSLKPKLHFPLGNIFAGFSRKGPPRFNIFKLKYLTGLAGLTFIACLGFLVVSLVGVFFYPQRFTAADASVVSPGILNNTAAEIKPLSDYQAVLDNRQLFDQPIAAAPAREAGKGTIDMAEIISRYNLSGIISGDNPKAIVEDRKAQKSYFLKEGESAGDLTLEAIGQGKVSLDYKGEKFELVL